MFHMYVHAFNVYAVRWFWWVQTPKSLKHRINEYIWRRCELKHKELTLNIEYGRLRNRSGKKSSQKCWNQTTITRTTTTKTFRKTKRKIQIQAYTDRGLFYRYGMFGAKERKIHYQPNNFIRWRSRLVERKCAIELVGKRGETSITHCIFGSQFTVFTRLSFICLFIFLIYSNMIICIQIVFYRWYHSMSPFDYSHYPIDSVCGYLLFKIFLFDLLSEWKIHRFRHSVSFK